MTNTHHGLVLNGELMCEALTVCPVLKGVTLVSAINQVVEHKGPVLDQLTSVVFQFETTFRQVSLSILMIHIDIVLLILIHNHHDPGDETEDGSQELLLACFSLP